MLVCDFKTTCLNWVNINDVVMGGVSDSAMQLTPERSSVFTGNLSLENSGGFASVRTALERQNYDGFAGFRIRVKGDGKRYSFRARHDERFDGVVYKFDSLTSRPFRMSGQRSSWLLQNSSHLFVEEFLTMFRRSTGVTSHRSVFLFPAAKRAYSAWR